MRRRIEERAREIAQKIRVISRVEENGFVAIRYEVV